MTTYQHLFVDIIFNSIPVTVSVCALDFIWVENNN